MTGSISISDPQLSGCYQKKSNSFHFFPHFQRTKANPSETCYSWTNESLVATASNQKMNITGGYPMEVSTPTKKQVISNAADHKRDDKPVYIMATTSASTHTRSEFSTRGERSGSISATTDFTDDCSTSSMWSYSEPKPPKLINVAVESTSLPYAQLCFDKDTKTLAAIMEINLGGLGGRGRSRLRIVEPDEEQRQEEEDRYDPTTPYENMLLPSGYSNTGSTVSSGGSTATSTWHHAGRQELRVGAHERESSGTCSEPIVLSCFGPNNSWLEETDLDLYLLHDISSDAWDTTNGANRQGCADALKRLLVASRSLIVHSRRRSLFWESPPPQVGARQQHQNYITGIGYTVLDD